MAENSKRLEPQGSKPVGEIIPLKQRESPSVMPIPEPYRGCLILRKACNIPKTRGLSMSLPGLILFILLVFMQDALNAQIVPKPTVCKYPGMQTQEGVFIRTALSDPVFTHQNTQKFRANYQIRTITPDVMGIMLRIARLKQSEGDHPSDVSDDHANPRSDEDKVEYRWYIVPGQDPLFVFQGYDSPNGQYSLSGTINLGEEIPVVFEDLQTEKEYRVNLMIWTNWDSDPTIGFSRLLLEENRFRLDDFIGSSSSHLSVRKYANWANADQESYFSVKTSWGEVPEGDPPGFQVLSKDTEGSSVVVTPQPLLAHEFQSDLDTFFVQGAGVGAPVGIRAADTSGGFGLIGGGGILIDICKGGCALLGLGIPAVTLSAPVDNVIKLDWPAAANATAYDVYRAELACSNTFTYRGMTTLLNFQDTVKAQYSYAYKVRAKKGSCASDFSNCVVGSATGSPCTVLPSPAPAQPTNGATGVCATPTFSWASVPHASSGYLIEVFTNGTCAAPASYSATLPSTSLTWTLPGTLPADTLCSWHLKALGDDIYYCHSDFSSCRTFTTSAVGPTTPLLQKPGCGAYNQFLSPFFKWEPVPGAAMYLFELSASYCGQTPLTQETLSVPEWRCSLTLNANTAYYWMVTAKDANGCAGPQSRCCSFYTGPAACP